VQGGELGANSGPEQAARQSGHETGFRGRKELFNAVMGWIQKARIQGGMEPNVNFSWLLVLKITQKIREVTEVKRLPLLW
jgi:hypothetical protein